MKQSNYEFIVGTDVSKATLDYTILRGKNRIVHNQIENSPKGLKKLKSDLSRENIPLSKTLICCENTGRYNHQLLKWSVQENALVWVENAAAIHKSLGLVRGKNDKIDSYRIGLYAARYEENCKLWKPKRRPLNKLNTLAKTRKKILKLQGQIEKTLKEAKETGDMESYKIMQKHYKPILLAQDKSLKKIDQEMNELIKEDETLKENFKIATSVEGVGKVTATLLMIHSNEFQDISDPKKMACYAGIAPFEHSSGSSIWMRPRVSVFANKELKSALHMAAVAAAHGKGELAEYYQRKLKEGKSKMVILNAIRNKIIQRVYACIRDKRLYEKNYVKKFA